MGWRVQMRKSWKIHVKKIGLWMITSLFVLLCSLGYGSKVYAAIDITPTKGILYTIEGAEALTSLEGETQRIPLPADVPLNVTGVTNVGYFRITVNEVDYYIHINHVIAKEPVPEMAQGEIHAAAALVGNAITGEIYYSQDAMIRRAPASTTKVMTALLVLEAIDAGQLTLDTPLKISASALAGMPADASHVTPRLKKGEVMTVLSLLECVLIRSDCHACNVLAEAVSGSVDKFVARMNQRAVELGCVDTKFVNTSGYPHDQHYSNAYSIFLITQEAVKHQDFRTIVSLQEITIPATNLTQARKVTTTNELIKPDSQYYNPNAFGIKTGSANSSGLCMVAGAVEQDKMVLSVVLGAAKEVRNGALVNNQFWESNHLLNYALKK